MKFRGDSLRSVRETDRQTIADEKLYDHQITNNLDLRSIEQQKLESLQPDYWSEELNERRLVQEEEEELSQRLDEHDKQIERQKRIGRLKIILQQQMNEIKQKEKEVFFSYIYSFFEKTNHLNLVRTIKTRRRTSSQRTIPIRSI